jgi:hypothetical protein
MRRLSICLFALALSISLGACGRSEPQHATTAPSLTVNVDLTIQLKGHRVTTINLMPSGHPSGVVALKAVHNGRLVTIGSQHFSRLNDSAYLVVQVSARDIELGWNIPQAAQDAKSSCAVAFLAGSTWAGADYGNETVDPETGDVGETVWDLTLDVGKTTTDGSGISGASAASVTESTKFPTETAYCVTVTVDRT